MEEVCRGLMFPEGPIAMDDGSVVLVEIERKTLSRVSPDGKISVVADCGGGPNGAAVGPDGRVYICNNGGFVWTQQGPFRRPGDTLAPDYVGGSIQAVDIKTGAVETIYTECNGESLKGPNDIVFDAQGAAGAHSIAGRSSTRNRTAAASRKSSIRSIRRTVSASHPTNRRCMLPKHLAHGYGPLTSNAPASLVLRCTRSFPAGCCTSSVVTSVSIRWRWTLKATWLWQRLGLAA